MALTMLDTGTVQSRWLAAATLLVRVAASLPLYALRHPGRPLVVSRASGRVTLR